MSGPREDGLSSGFRVDLDGEIAIVTCLQSHYRADSFSDFRAALSAAAEAASGPLLIDLENVVLLSSSALRALREANGTLAGQGRRIVAAGGGDLVRAALKFASFVSHHDDLPAAKSAIAGHGAAGLDKETGA